MIVAYRPFGRLERLLAGALALLLAVTVGGVGDAAARAPAATPPPSRCCGALAYDTTRQVLVLFGGINETSNFADTWTWNGTAWSQLTPAVSPGPLYDVALAYDEAHQQTVLFGGITPDSVSTSRTWTWDGTTWTQQSPVTSPPSRSLAHLAYDAAHQRVLLFGGCCGANGQELSDTWTWDGATWTQQSPTTGPVVSETSALTYDALHQQGVLFGGCCGMGNTWTWDGTNWTQQVTSVAPAVGGPMAFDAARGLVVLASVDGSTWTWNGTSWTEASPPTSPPARDQAALAYDAATQTALLVGGSIGGFSQGDAWSWSGTTWTQIN